MATNNDNFAGGCTCRHVRFKMLAEPMMVHGCHCTWCQRETGSAFAQNALIESNLVELTAGEVETVDTPSASGTGQAIVRCPRCHVALWSHYGGSDAFAFVRVGTLDEPHRWPPDVHIFTSTKQPWVVLPSDVPAFEAFYRRSEVWPEASLARRSARLAEVGG